MVNLGANKILTGDALLCLKSMESESVNCCVTSPPYYGLRDYGCQGQIGLEATPQEYIDKLVLVFREVRRVLTTDGTLWLNIADSYAGSGKGRNADGHFNLTSICKESYGQKSSVLSKTIVNDKLKRKDLIGIPWMLAFALRDDGWYLRQDIIWYKPNCMPEAVKDRCTKSHEYLFLLSKSDKYYFDYSAIREPAVGFDKSSPRDSLGTHTPNSGRRKGNSKTFRGGGTYTGGRSFENSNKVDRESHGNSENTTGFRNRRSVWSISTKGYAGAHFATFPEELVRPCILAGSKPNDVILDPFCGSGTVGAVSIQEGRNFIGIDLNPDYCQMSVHRIEKIIS